MNAVAQWFFLTVTSAVTGFAETQPAAAPAAGGLKEGLGPFIPLILMFGVFYFLIIRPQHKKQKQHQEFLNQLKRGDMVVTASGIIGTVRTVSDRIVTLEVDDGVCLKVVRGQISDNAAKLNEEAKAKALEGKPKPA